MFGHSVYHAYTLSVPSATYMRSFFVQIYL